MPHYPDEIDYSDKYMDDTYEYRHVILTKHIANILMKIPGYDAGHRLLSEQEWRDLGVQQSKGWVHYSMFKPEPHILLFRRPLGTNPETGIVERE